MAANFNYTTRIPSVQGTQVIQPPQPTPTPTNNTFVWGNRRNPTGSETNGLPILNPQAGFPMYEYYNTYKLPTQFLNNPIGMLSYFQSCGFTVGYGYSADITVDNINAIDALSLAANNQAILYFTNGADIISPLVGAGITGTFLTSTTAVTGNLVKAAVGSFTYLSNPYDSYIIVQSSQFASIITGENIAIDFVNSNLLVPDANTTEPFIMNLYSHISAALIPINVNSTVSTPNVYFSFLPNVSDSGLFGATASTVGLSVPVAVPSSTQINFTIPSNNVFIIPLTALGHTTFTQATSGATGTLVKSVINNNVLQVTLSNVTGTFDNIHTVSIHLDPTQTVMSFQQTLFANNNLSLQQFVLPYAINTNSDITTTYKPAFDYVAALNQPQTSQDGQALCFIVFTNTSIAIPSAVMNLPDNVNNWQYIPVYYPYNPIIGELPANAAQISAAAAMVIGSNVAPLNPQSGVIINGLPVSSNQSTYVPTNIGGIGDQILQLGWNVIAVNNNSQAYLVNPITGQITLPNLPTPDKEFFNTYVWQTIDLLRKGVTLICQNIGLGQVRQTPKVISVLKAQIISFMEDMENQGMLLNVLKNQAFVTIIQDPNNPLGIDIQIPAQIVPGLQQIYYTINIFSSTVTLQNQA